MPSATQGQRVARLRLGGPFFVRCGPDGSVEVSQQGCVIFVRFERTYPRSTRYGSPCTVATPILIAPRGANPMSTLSLTEQAMQQLEQLIVEEMPITQHLEFSLAADDDGRLRASAPLEPNANHMGTAFGGSLSMLATVTGWAMMHQLVTEKMEDMRRRVEVIIQESDIEYLKPVCENISVICEPPDEDAVKRFQKMLDRWGRARLDLQCKIDAAGERAVTFIGRYVALAKDEAGENGISGNGTPPVTP